MRQYLRLGERLYLHQGLVLVCLERTQCGLGQHGLRGQHGLQLLQRQWLSRDYGKRGGRHHAWRCQKDVGPWPQVLWDDKRRGARRSWMSSMGPGPRLRPGMYWFSRKVPCAGPAGNMPGCAVAGFPMSSGLPVLSPIAAPRCTVVAGCGAGTGAGRGVALCWAARGDWDQGGRCCRRRGHVRAAARQLGQDLWLFRLDEPGGTRELLDVSELSTTQIENGYITLSWQRPHGRFDYYSIEAIENGSSTVHRHKLGLCANGTIIHPDQTQLTCGPYEQCTTLSYAMRTHLNGPQQRSSPGVQVKDIFIPPEVPPDVTNLHLVRIGANDFTIAWTKPKFSFNYYWIDVTGVKNAGTRATPGTTGSCVNGTIIHPDWTQVTCSQLQPCSNISEYGPQTTGIPEVVKLKQTAIANNSVTVSWERPKGCFDDYLVTTSAENTELASQETSAGTCGNGTIVPTNETSVTCDGIRVSSVSIMVQTRRLKSDGLISQGVTLQEITMTKLVLPDVTNFSLIDVGPDYFTVSWARPSSYFDYYWVEVYDNSNGTDIPTPHRVGSCAYGNIIHRDQNQITCDKFKACVNASITVHTQSKGPSGLTSPGATLRGIFVPGRDLVDFDLYVDRLRTSTAEIIIDPHLPRSCPPRYCGASICVFQKSEIDGVSHHLSKLALRSNQHIDLQEN
ncbi:hypothetical protein MRX96_031377 [Rhipicephalus microplus]